MCVCLCVCARVPHLYDLLSTESLGIGFSIWKLESAQTLPGTQGSRAEVWEGHLPPFSNVRAHLYSTGLGMPADLMCQEHGGFQRPLHFPGCTEDLLLSPHCVPGDTASLSPCVSRDGGVCGHLSHSLPRLFPLACSTAGNEPRLSCTVIQQALKGSSVSVAPFHGFPF